MPTSVRAAEQQRLLKANAKRLRALPKQMISSTSRKVLERMSVKVKNKEVFEDVTLVLNKQTASELARVFCALSNQGKLPSKLFQVYTELLRTTG